MHLFLFLLYTVLIYSYSELCSFTRIIFIKYTTLIIYTIVFIQNYSSNEIYKIYILK